MVEIQLIYKVKRFHIFFAIPLFEDSIQLIILQPSNFQLIALTNIKNKYIIIRWIATLYPPQKEIECGQNNSD